MNSRVTTSATTPRASFDGARPLRVAILGTGNIGTDLLLKVLKSPWVECTVFAGRRGESPGLQLANSLGVQTSTGGVEAVVAASDDIDIVFDATSAGDARKHWAAVGRLGLQFIDLTPAHMGNFCIPALDLSKRLHDPYVSMVTCGGQAAVPIASCISQAFPHAVDYMEIVSTSSSMSVGAASRANLDEYLLTTDDAVRAYCAPREVKTILVVNPAEPGIIMRNTISVPFSPEVDIESLRDDISRMESRIRSYVPGYRVSVPLVRSGENLAVTVEVEGLGDWLPRHAGNLDIITCAALAVAEARARTFA